MSESTSSLITRARNILLQPRTEWPVIDGESTSANALYMGYIIPLAAVPVIAAFIGLTLFGIPNPFGPTYHVPMVRAITSAVVRYCLSLASVYVIAMIADALAPSFGGTKNMTQALKAVAYSSTAGWLAGIFAIYPLLGVLGLLGLYSLYLLYLGLPVLMKVPQDKALGYAVTVIIAAIVVFLVIGAIATRFVGVGRMM